MLLTQGKEPEGLGLELLQHPLALRDSPGQRRVDRPPVLERPAHRLEVVADRTEFRFAPKEPMNGEFQLRSGAEQTTNP